MTRVLLDKDILSEILKGRNRTVARRSSAYEFEHGVFTTSAVSVSEIVAGLSRNGDAGVIAFVDWFDRHQVLVLDREAGRFGGEIYARLRSAGTDIGLPDCLIAGTAMANDLTLVTGNTKHFQRVVDLGFTLRLENWRDESR